MPNIYSNIIELDLDRTFAEDENFIKNNPINRNKLKNILLSYARRNPCIGYCQGMTFLSAIVLRAVKDEENTFWILVNLLESILPLDYYSNMVEVLVDQKVFLYLLQQRKPGLYQHLLEIGLDVAMILLQWFLCIFTTQLKREAAESIWDFLFLEGTVTIFRATFAILNVIENDIQNCSDFSDVYILDIDEDEIKKLRNIFRPQIQKEQSKAWIESSQAKCPLETDTNLNKKLKFMYKFTFLDRFIRDQFENFDESLLKPIHFKRYKCIGNPLCIYDFTMNSRIANYFCFKTAGPATIIQDYFGEDTEGPKGFNSVPKFIFIPDTIECYSLSDVSKESKKSRRTRSEVEFINK